jgi:hypothetical protein
VNAAGEEEVVRLQVCELDPVLNRVTSRCRDLELDGTLGLVLHHNSPRGQLAAVADIPDFESYEITAAKLAVDSQVEECELAHAIFHLEADAERPDVLELERCLLTDDLALVPWLAMNCVGYGSHDGLPSN